MKHSRLLIAGAGVFLMLLAVLSLFFGSYPLTFREVFMEPGSMAARVFWGLRLPRVVCGILCGGILGLSGAVYQTVFANPLASPDVTGVASGSSVGAALAIVLGSGGTFLRMGLSFVFGMLSLVLVMAVVRASSGERSGSYLLAGILVSSLGEAALMLLKTFADPERELAALEFWTMGSLAAVKSDRMLPLAGIGIPAIVLLLLFRRSMTALSLGEASARNAGLDPKLWRAILLMLSTLAVSASVCVAGVIGFIGLIAPHAVRLLYRRRDGAFFSLSLLFGAILLLTADLLARTLSPMAELPLSIFTAVFAGAVLLGLMIGKGGRGNA